MAAEKVVRPHVLAAVETVQTELAKVGIAKDRVNQGQNFKFRGIDQVLMTLSGLLAANRLHVAMTVFEHHFSQRATKSGGIENAATVTARFTATSLTDGSTLDLGTYSGEAQDSRDKSLSKAHSICYKYAMFLSFCIPLEGVLDDPDADSPGEATSSPAKASKADKATDAPAKTKTSPKGAQAAGKGVDIDAELARIEALTELKDADALAMELRALKSHERFTEIKTALKAKLAELK